MCHHTEMSKGSVLGVKPSLNLYAVGSLEKARKNSTNFLFTDISYPSFVNSYSSLVCKSM